MTARAVRFERAEFNRRQRLAMLLTVTHFGKLDADAARARVRELSGRWTAAEIAAATGWHVANVYAAIGLRDR